MFINIQVYNAEKQACKIFPRIYGVIDKSVLEILYTLLYNTLLKSQQKNNNIFDLFYDKLLLIYTTKKATI